MVQAPHMLSHVNTPHDGPCGGSCPERWPEPATILVGVPSATGFSGALSGRDNPADITITSDAALSAAFYEAVGREPSAVTVALSGTPTADDTWCISLAGSDYDHTVTAAQSTAEVAQALAARLDSAPGLAGLSEAETVAVVDPAGGALAPQFTVIGGSSRTIDTATPLTHTAELSGVVSPGETWQIDIDGAIYRYTPGDAESAFDVAVGLVTAADVQGDDYVVRAEGDVVVVTSTSGEPFTLSVTPGTDGSWTLDSASFYPTLVNVGESVNAGDEWRIAVEGSESSCTVAAGDTGADVAAGLAPALDTTSPDAVILAPAGTDYTWTSGTGEGLSDLATSLAGATIDVTLTVSSP